MSEHPAPARDPDAEALARAIFGPLLDLADREPSRWRLVGWDVEQGLTLTLAKGHRALLFELEGRDDQRDCYARTARFNVCVRAQFAPDPGALTPEERSVAAQVVGVVRAREAAAPAPARPSAERAEVREVRVGRVLIPEGQGQYYLNPYVGCMIGCPFCYVADRADFSRMLHGRDRVPWGRWVDVKTNAPDVLRAEVARHPPGIVRMSPILTDPYQPLERRYRITRGCLEVLCDAGFTPVVLTRAARVLDDLPLLRRFPRAAVGLSIPTDDDSIRRVFEPGGDPIDDRLAALAACHDAGITTFLVVQPMLPMDPERLIERTAHHVRAVRIDRMYELPRALPLYEACRRTDAASPAFFDELGARLRRGYAARGVALDELDDLGRALGLR